MLVGRYTIDLPGSEKWIMHNLFSAIYLMIRKSGECEICGWDSKLGMAGDLYSCNISTNGARYSNRKLKQFRCEQLYQKLELVVVSDTDSNW